MHFIGAIFAKIHTMAAWLIAVISRKDSMPRILSVRLALELAPTNARYTARTTWFSNASSVAQWRPISAGATRTSVSIATSGRRITTS